MPLLYQFFVQINKIKFPSLTIYLTRVICIGCLIKTALLNTLFHIIVALNKRTYCYAKASSNILPCAK